MMTCNYKFSAILLFSGLFFLSLECSDNCDTCLGNKCLFCNYNYYLYMNSCQWEGSTTIGLSGGAIAGIIIGGVILLIVIVLCICRRCRRTQDDEPQPNVIYMDNGQPRPDYINNNGQPNMMSLTNFAAYHEEKWISLPAGEVFNTWDICSICLDKQINGQLSCGHGFHGKCLVDWSKRTMTCPDCRADIYDMQIFCSICCQQYRMINLRGGQPLSQQNSICYSCR